MRLITRHILRALTAPFLWGVAALTGLLLLNQLAPLIDRFGGKGLGAEVMLEAVVLALPALLTLTIPMSVLVATLYAYSTLAADLEMVAMYANGLSVWRMVRPALIAAVGITLVNYLLFDQIVPLSNSRYKTLQLAVYNVSPTLSLRAEELNELGTAGYVLRAHEIRPEDGRMTDISIYDLLRYDGRRAIHADSGRMARSPTGADLLLTLYDGEAIDYSTAEPTRIERTTFRINVVRLADVEREFTRSLGLAERGDREKSGCELLDGITESEWRFTQAARQRERLTRRDLRNLAGLPPLPPPAAEAMPDFAPHCVGPMGRVQRALERAFLPGELEAQEPVPPVQDPVRVTQDSLRPAQDSLRPRDSLGAGTDSASGLLPRLPAGALRERLAAKDSLAAAEVTSQDSGQGLGDEAPEAPLGPADPADPALAGPGADGLPPFAQGGQRLDGIVVNMNEIIAARLNSRENLRTMREYDVEYHKKFAIPLASFCFVLVGVALALKFPRSGIGLVIGGSLLIFLLFYVLLIGGENLANDGVISAEVAMYAPVIVLTLIGVAAVAAADREMGTARSVSIVEWLVGLLPRRRRRESP
ncbi:MAG TPA: LptF/LptG family permease [Gemmatimonadales bacterium]|nr:LptF/LptG family permease [Gemmatimonadales bacterium]